jgi:hypothetical protein
MRGHAGLVSRHRLEWRKILECATCLAEVRARFPKTGKPSSRSGCHEEAHHPSGSRWPPCRRTLSRRGPPAMTQARRASARPSTAWATSSPRAAATRAAGTRAATLRASSARRNADDQRPGAGPIGTQNVTHSSVSGATPGLLRRCRGDVGVPGKHLHPVRRSNCHLGACGGSLGRNCDLAESEA